MSRYILTAEQVRALAAMAARHEHSIDMADKTSVLPSSVAEGLKAEARALHEMIVSISFCVSQADEVSHTVPEKDALLEPRASVHRLIPLGTTAARVPDRTAGHGNDVMSSPDMQSEKSEKAAPERTS